MIENVLNSPILTDPWLHQIIDSFFDETDFEKIWDASKRLQEAYKDKTITANDCLTLAEVLDVIGDDVFDIVLKTNIEILDHITEITQQYPNHYRHNEYISFPTFHILPPNTDYQKIHDESNDKTISIVVYLYPTNSTGTLLYKSNDRNSLIKEIEWKPNRAMLFCGENNTTWHDFYSREYPRVTLNYFVRTIHSKKLMEEGNKYYWTFGNGMKAYIPKDIPKEKLKILTESVFRKI